MWKRMVLAAAFLSVLIAVPALAGEPEASASGAPAVETAPSGPGPACCGACGMGRGYRGGTGPEGGTPPGGGWGCCRGPGAAGSDDDHQVFFFLLDNRDRIRREVRNTENGIETLTESDDPEIVGKIREHVAAMYARLEEGRGIHLRDPLFAEIFRNTDKIQMEMEPTEHGVRVRETSSDPEVVQLIQEHARVVSQFLENGHAEMRRDHPVR